MPSLTRVEATDRAGRLRVESYAIELDLIDARTQDWFDSSTTIVVHVQAPITTFVELRPVELVQALMDGVPLPPASLADNRLPLTLSAGRHELVVRARMGFTNSGQGMHRFVDPVDGQTYLHAQSFLDDAQRVFACFDQPDLKAPLSLTVAAPEGWLVAGNAPGVQRSPGRWVFEPTPPIATYVFSLIAGPYHAQHREHDGIPLAIYCRQSIAGHLDRDADELFGLTAAFLDREQALFGTRYPYGRYDQAFLPELNPTAMENVGLVAIHEDKLPRYPPSEDERELRAAVIAHEMAHMWFGNLVTMRWWDDLWLNESFAEYLGFRVLAQAGVYPDAWAGFVVTRTGWAYAADQRPSTHPVAGAAVVDTGQALTNFDGISYAKGASVLRQLAAFVGDEAFLDGLRRHIATHAHGNATLADLLDSLSTAAGRDLSGWADAWLRTAGINTLTPVITADGTVHIRQTGQPQRPHTIRVALRHGGEVPALAVPVQVAARGESPVPGLGAPRPGELLLVNDGSLTYAKIRFDETGAAALPAALAALTDPLARALVWIAAVDAVRDGLSTVDEFAMLVEAGLGREPRPDTVRELVRLSTHRPEHAGSPHLGVLLRYAPPDRCAAVQSRLAGIFRAAAASFPDGARRRAALVGFAGAAGLDELAALRALLSSADDPDVRWSVLARLCGLGAAAETEIDDLAAGDASAQGQVWARRCRAALPDAASRARAWHELTTRTDLSNRLLQATAEGFWQPGRPAADESYVELYFVALLPALRSHAPSVAAKLAGAAFPRFAAEERTLALADDFLSTMDVGPVLARVVGDWADEMRRVIVARARVTAGGPR